MSREKGQVKNIFVPLFKMIFMGENNIDGKCKMKGQVFTPVYMVKAMLDWCNYTGVEILCRHITDNSCGDGAFLVEVVHRYIQAALEKGLSPSVIKRQLQTYIHGLDNDPEAVVACRNRLDDVAAQYGINRVAWRVYRMDSLACRLFDGMMDYVVGNPPYVRIHNLDGITYDLIQECSFSEKGLSDLYLAFFELAFRTLKKGGQLCYITPVSWIYSKAGQKFRQYILHQRNMVELVDMGHHQVFPNVSTYTVVSRFVKDMPQESFLYSIFDGQKLKKGVGHYLSLGDIYIDNSFYLSDKDTLSRLRQIKAASDNQNIKVKNGFATLADKIFINGDIPDSPFTIQAVKASTGKWSRCLFPYHEEGRGVDWLEICEFPSLKKYLMENRIHLKKRDIRQDEWWLYGRTQALNCVRQPKLSVNMLIRDVDDLKIVYVAAGCGVYSGYYISATDDELLHRINDALRSSDFIRYVKALKKYKSGGYFTFSAKDLEQYLHYRFPEQE